MSTGLDRLFLHLWKKNAGWAAKGPHTGRVSSTAGPGRPSFLPVENQPTEISHGMAPRRASISDQRDYAEIIDTSSVFAEHSNVLRFFRAAGQPFLGYYPSHP